MAAEKKARAPDAGNGPSAGNLGGAVGRIQPTALHLLYVRNADSMEQLMSLEAVSALIGVAVAMTWAPGPNNAMLSALGANFGWRRSVSHVMGVTVGFPVMLVVVALGFIRGLDAFPVIVDIFGWIGLIMLAWLAWRIATAAGTAEGIQGSPLVFLEAIAFQWVNPKAWALAIHIIAGYALGEAVLSNTLLAAGVFLFSGLASSCTWAVFGGAKGKRSSMAGGCVPLTLRWHRSCWQEALG